MYLLPLVLGYMNDEERNAWNLAQEESGDRKTNPIYTNIPSAVKTLLCYAHKCANANVVPFGIYLKSNIDKIDPTIPQPSDPLALPGYHM